MPMLKSRRSGQDLRSVVAQAELSNRLLDAVNEALVDLTIETPAMARLALLYHEARPNELGKENCTCGEQDTWDECPTLADQIAFLQRLADRPEIGETGKSE